MVHLPFQIAFVFAALISSTDAAIVIKTFKMLKVPKLLSTILEMESSFNDATGIIIFTFVVGIVFSLPPANTTISAISADNFAFHNSNQINIDILT